MIGLWDPYFTEVKRKNSVCILLDLKNEWKRRQVLSVWYRYEKLKKKKNKAATLLFQYVNENKKWIRRLCGNLSWCPAVGAGEQHWGGTMWLDLYLFFCVRQKWSNCGLMLVWIECSAVNAICYTFWLEGLACLK